MNIYMYGRKNQKRERGRRKEKQRKRERNTKINSLYIKIIKL